MSDREAGESARRDTDGQTGVGGRKKAGRMRKEEDKEREKTK